MSEIPEIPLNDLSRWDEESRVNVLALIDQVLRSGQFLNGPFTGMLQTELSLMLHGREVLLVGNGTDALTIALLASGVGPGDRVATVSNAGGYATGAIFRVGATPVLIDVDYRSAQMSSDDLKSKLEKNWIKAVVVTHLYGMMADIEVICNMVKQYDCILIEDCAQSIGARVLERPAGTFGDISTFSFYPTKNLGAAGDAGAVSFANSEHALKAKRISQYGWRERYAIDIPHGFNSRIDEIQAVVILERLKQLAATSFKRREIIGLYDTALVKSRRMIHTTDESFVGHLAVLVTTERSADMQQLSKNGIRTTIHYPILDHHQRAWRECFDDIQLEASEKLVSEILTIPCFPELADSEVERICDTLCRLGS